MPFAVGDLVKGVKKLKVVSDVDFDKQTGGGGTDSKPNKTHTGATHELDSEFAHLVQKAQQGAHRLRDVFAKKIQMVADFVPPVYHKSDVDTKFLNDALSDSFIFSHLNQFERKILISAFEPYNVTESHTIIQQGSTTSEYFFVIQEGTVQVVIDGIEVGTETNGQSFGELALLYDSPRSASCIAMTDCKLWRLDQKTFRRILASYDIQKDDGTRKLLEKVEFLKGMDDRTLSKMACSLDEVSYKKGDMVVERGGQTQEFFIIKEGTIKGTDIEVGESKYDDITLSKGEYFGEYAIYKNVPIVANVTCLTDVTVLRMDRENFLRQFGNLEEVIRRCSDIKRLRMIPIKNRPKVRIYEAEALSAVIEEKSYKKGHVFFKEGQASEPTLYMVRHGKVEMHTSANVLEFLTGLKIKKGDSSDNYIVDDGFFGDDSLDTNVITKKGLHYPKYTATAEEDCTIGVLTLEAMTKVLSGIKSGVGAVQLEDMLQNKILGKGTFGTVWLVSMKDKVKDNETYALKVQNKRKLIEYGQVEGVIYERDIMAECDNDLIIKLVDSFQDKRNIYMLTKLYPGGELRSIMTSKKRHALPEWAAKFYAATVFEGLSYMHRRHILFRDLKPENVMLDKDGYTVIIDLGFAKIVPNDKTYTFCGTPLYLAPEVILQKGHGPAYDNWSWGVMVYEMIVGMTPFYDGKMDQQTLFKHIVKGKFRFPAGNYMSVESKDLITKMLVVNPRERLGSLAGGDMDIYNHSWFAGDVDWKKLESKETKAPWVPKVKDNLDTSNFSEWEDEEPDKDEKPLTDKEEKMFSDF